jgi:hypothetical protein
VVSLSRTSLAFGNQVLDVPVSATVTLSNTGDATLGITSIAGSGDFSATHNCGTSLAAQGQCTITVTFQPTALGARLGSLTFTDSAPDSPQSVSLSGTGVQIGFAPTSLIFGNQIVGTTGATQTVSVSNLGNSALSITSIVASTGFTENNNCGTSLAGNATCTITIAFAPTAAGPVNGLVTVNYSGTQGTIAVSGNGIDFNLGAQSGGSTTATVSAGGTASYNLSASGTSGFSGSATLACSGAPTAASCSVNPTSVTLNGTTPQNFTVSVTTTARAWVWPPIRNLPMGWLPPQLLMAATLALLLMAWQRLRPRRTRLAVLAASVGAWLLVAGCGGGGGGAPKVTGTPAGTYTITLTATSGSANRTLSLTLNVN